jgi:glycosyltransferase involved in cell wall biosynthesis
MLRDITYFHWNKNNGPSIGRSFRPLIDKIKKTENVREYYVPYKGASPLKLIKNIYFVYKHRTKTGINHITGDIHYCILGLIGCKSVLTIHDDYAMVTAQKGFLDKFYKWLFWIYLPIKLADKVICISDATKQKIDKLVKNQKTEIITHHSVDTEFKYIPKIFNSKYPVILQIGTDPQKNLETTIKILAGLNCKLRVIKKMTNKQHQLAWSLKIDYSNVFNLSDQEIINEYANADIVMFPSLFEGLGMPIMEAQATGRVIITSNFSPMDNIAGNGGILLNNPLDVEEYRTALLNIINNSSYRENLIVEGLKNVKRFSAEKAAQSYLNLYNTI